MSNTRTITALVAFVVAFVFSAGLVRIIFPAAPVATSCFKRPVAVERSSNDIENFLLRDIRNGDARMDDRYTDNYAKAVRDYWRASSSMDASEFPRDFQKAWRVHMQAWKNYADYLEESQYSSERRNRGEGRMLIREINSTWEDVKGVGRNYGAYVE